MNICIYIVLAAILLLLAVAFVATISRVNAEDDNDPPTIVAMPAEEMGDIVDIRKFHKDWDER